MEPITRKELFLAKAGGMDVKTPEPITREEMFLSRIGGGADNPQGGGGVVPTAAEKIVDYTVDADGAAATSFSFTVAEYPKLAEYNHLRGIFRKATNGSIPWVQLVLNTSAYNNNCVGKTAGGNMGMCGFDIIKKGSYYNGGISGPVNTSMYDAWENQSMFANSNGHRLTPLYIANLTMVSLASYAKFLDEGGRIEIWGWNE